MNGVEILLMQYIYKAGARHRSARQNIYSGGNFSWLENRADISRADNTSLILFSFIVLYRDGKKFENIPYDRAVNAVQIYWSYGN